MSTLSPEQQLLRAFCSLHKLRQPNISQQPMFYTERLTAALLERFDDMDEIRDICSHGCEGGVSGFIYYKDTREFFEEFEDDIEDVCYDILGTNYLEQLAKGETCVLGLINKLVWFTVEAYCHHRLQQHENLAAV